MSDLKNKVVDGAFWLGGARVFSQAITWIFTILIARILVPEDYGLLAMAAVYIGLAEFVNEFGVTSAIIQKVDITEDEVGSLYTVSILFGILMAALTFLIAPVLAQFFNEDRLVPIVQVLAVTFVFSSIKNVQNSLLIRSMKFKTIAKIQTVSLIGASVLSYICAVKGFGVWTLIVQYLSLNFFMALMFFCCVRCVPGSIRNFREIKSLVFFGVQVMLSNLISALTGRVDNLIIGRLLGVATLGIYSFAVVQAAKPLGKLLMVLDKLFFPLFSKVQNDKPTLRRYFLKSIELELLILLPVYAILTIVAKDLFVLLLGTKWVGMVFPFQVFCFVGLFKFLRSSADLLSTSIGRPSLRVYYSLVTLVLMSIVMLVLGTLYGINGVLLTWTTVYPVIMAVYFFHVTSLIGVSFKSLIDHIRLPALGTFFMLIALIILCKYLPFKDWYLLLSMVVVGFVVYSVVLVIIDRNKIIALWRVIRTRGKEVPVL